MHGGGSGAPAERQRRAGKRSSPSAAGCTGASHGGSTAAPEAPYRQRKRRLGVLRQRAQQRVALVWRGKSLLPVIGSLPRSGGAAAVVLPRQRSALLAVIGWQVLCPPTTTSGSTWNRKQRRRWLERAPAQPGALVIDMEPPTAPALARVCCGPAQRLDMEQRAALSRATPLPPRHRRRRPTAGGCLRDCPVG